MAKRNTAATVAGTVADPTVRFFDLELDGNIYRLAFSFNSIAEAEAETKCNLLQGIAGVVMSTMTALQFRGLFWAALRIGQPKMTLEDAGRLITIHNLVDIKEALLASWGISMPDKKAEDPQQASAPVES